MQLLVCLRFGKHPQPGRRFHQTFQQQRIERAAFPAQNHGNCRIMVKGFLVAPFTGQSIVNISQSHNLSRNGNLLSPQSVRIAVSVPTLMVPTADFHCIAKQRLVLTECHLFQYFRADGGMGLYHSKFFFGQFPGFVQNFFRNADFSDIVECRRRFDERNIRLGKPINIRFHHQLAQQQLCHCANVADMGTAFMVAKLHHVAENFNHQVVILLFLVNLVGYQFHQPLLIGIKVQRILHPAADNECIEGSADIICNAQGVCLLHKAAGVLGRNHDNRNLVYPMEPVHLFQNLKSVHFRHIDVQQHQVHHQILFKQTNSLPTV